MLNQNHTQPKIAIILPSLNEELTIQKSIVDFHQMLPQAQIVVVDNASTDSTHAIAQKTIQSICPNQGIVLFEPKKGKSFAVRKAFLHVQADIYVMVDADCTYFPQDLQKLIQPIVLKQADMVVGNRLSFSTYQKQNSRPFHYFGNTLIQYLVNFLFKSSLTDIMSGYRIFNRKFIKNFPVLSSGFELETAMTIYALDKRFDILEIPISYQARTSGSFSKLRTISDGFRVIKLIFSLFKNYKPFLFFGFFSLSFFVFSLIFGLIVVLEFIETQFITHLPLAILSTGLAILSFLFLGIALILDSIKEFHSHQVEIQIIHDHQNHRW